ncbi:L,D-transpeptidase [Geomonas sp. Red32]|uniref:L,D-transpeptidase n=1 Tax=Geomonas sp. Red32 TaxID=2912856 RepID=UPI00202CFC69|nr:L,D-transpeptidase [Geomonas sp. Red32]MCM0082072.1 L,D-transpeptidase [Geomonas sp. Red32]
MCWRWLLLAVLIIFLPVLPEPLAQPVPAEDQAVPSPRQSYYIEISISGNWLKLYEKTPDGELDLVAQYPVGTAVRGLATYPTGLGKITGIYFDPWWHPTPYSRQVFRGRGIILPSAVPPGDPLNYMGPFKIALSHRTWKGAIYRIHGNNNPKRVGRRVTGGCFVMNNDQGLALAHRIKVGTEVNILP